MSTTATSQSAAKPAPLNVAADFPPPTYADWRQLVEAELKGVPFEKKLVARTYEGIALQPIYRREDVADLPHVASLPGFAPFVRGRKASGYLTQSWEVSQEIFNSSPAEFNTAARAYLGRGLTGLNIVLDQATRNGQDPDTAAAGEVGAGGLSVATLADMAKALDGVDLEKVPLLVRSGASALPFAALLVALCQKQGKAVSALRGCIEMDPLGVLAHAGKLPQSLAGAYREMAELVRWAAKQAPELQTVCVHSRSWHEAGSNAAQELAFALATGVDYLRALNARGLGVNLAAPRVRFALTVGANFFTEIAKLRAARMLWATAVAALGGNAEAQKLTLHVRTSLWNKTVLDPHVNLLRGTVEAFAGVMGGCDSLQVGAFDEVVRTPDEFSQRIARNTQIILQKECDLDRVIDPAGGAWFVERLTDSIARAAWALFQEVEKRGGMAAAMKAGFPQAEVAKTAAEKLKNVATRRDVIIGTNQFANLKEKPLPKPACDAAAFQRLRAEQVAAFRTSADEAQSTAVIAKLAKIVEAGKTGLFATCVEAVAAGATLGEITRALRANDQPDAPVTPVKLQRAAQEFERLRAAVECYAAGTGARPKVFLANMGPLAQYKARADFSRGFFAVGGFDTVYPKGFATVEEAAAKALESGAPVIVICSTDETYPALVPGLVKAIKDKDARRTVVLAGYPPDQVAAHQQAGVDEFVHVRVNAVELLTNLLKKVGVAL
jgi:methylmalonyl-CoA mutase